MQQGTTGIEKLIALQFGFYAFSHHLHVKLLSQSDHSLYSSGSASGSIEPIDTGAVNLDSIHKQVFETAENACPVPKSSIIDDDSNAKFAEAFQLTARANGINVLSLSNFKFKQIWVEAVSSKRPCDHSGEIRVAELNAGDVYKDAYGFRNALVPDPCQLARLLKNSFADSSDMTGFFG